MYSPNETTEITASITDLHGESTSCTYRVTDLDSNIDWESDGWHPQPTHDGPPPLFCRAQEESKLVYDVNEENNVREDVGGTQFMVKVDVDDDPSDKDDRCVQRRRGWKRYV